MDALATYILGAMLVWTPVNQQYVRDENGKLVQEDSEGALARYTSIAEDFSAVAQDVDEGPLFEGSDGRVKTCLQLASVASLESKFQKFVDEGTCNDPNYKPDARGNCDSHSSWTIFQIKPFSGLMFTEKWMTQAMYNPTRAKEHPEEVWTGQRLVKDRRTATKVALHLMRYSYNQHGSLCAYTGEKCGKDNPHPLADNRKKRAVDYFAAHPFSIPPTKLASNE